MTEREILDFCREGVKRLLMRESGGHDYYHCLRVCRMAETIAEREGADVFTACLAALLHDADDIKLFPETAAEKLNARKLMTECGIDRAKQDHVCRMIDDISFKGTGSTVPDSLEGRCAQDADRLDALGAIGIARTFAFGGKHSRAMYDPEKPPREHMTEAEYRSSDSSSVNHFYEKLFRLKALMNTETAKREAEKREKLMRDYISAFMKEWSGEID